MISTASNVTYIPATRVVGVQKTPEEKPKLRVAAYCRVSTDSDEQETSFEAQVDHYTKYISDNKDWIFAGIYADEGISAMNTKKRDEFNRMIADCLAGKIDKIITKSVSRFARNTMDCLENVRKLKAKNIAVYFEKENIDTLDAKGEVLLTIMASLAQQESESIGKNVTLGLQYRYQQGKVLVNYNRFLGYTKGDNGTLVIVPEEAEIVKRIYREYLEGRSLIKIAKSLQADGIKNGAGNTKWWDSNIRQILTNEKYMGDALLQKTYTADPLEKKRVKNNGDRPQYYVEGCLEPIIPKEVFLQVQSEISRRAGLLSEDRHCLHSSGNALSGIVRCGICGNQFRRVHWNNRGCKSIVWRCTTRLKEKNECKARTVKEEEIQKAVVDAMNELFGDKSSFALELRKNVEEMLIDTSIERASQIDRELKELQKQVVWDVQNEAAIGKKIINLRNEKRELYSQRSKTDEICKTLNSLMSFLESDGVTEYNDDLVRFYISEIRIFDDKIRVLFKAGLEIEVA